MTDKRPPIKPEALSALIRQYLAEELDDKAMHYLERQALDDPFLAAALEGYAQHPPNQQLQQEDLAIRLVERIASQQRKMPATIKRWVAAAAILILIFSGSWLFWKQQQKIIPLVHVHTPPPETMVLDGNMSAAVPDEVNETLHHKVSPAKEEDKGNMVNNYPRAINARRKLADKITPSGPVTSVRNQSLVTGMSVTSIPKDSLNAAVIDRKQAKWLISQPAIAKNIDSARWPQAGKLVARNAKEAAVADRQENSTSVQPPLNVPLPVTGAIEFEKYLRTHTLNPGNKYEGIVRICFTVMPDSSLHDFSIIHYLNDACDAEAIRVVKEGPAWIPAPDKQPAKVILQIKFTKEKN